MLEKMRRSVVEVIASRHIAGRDLGDALRVCRWAAGRGFRAIVSPWGAPDDSPGRMFDFYRAALDAIGTEGFSAYLSIKLDAIRRDAGMFDDLLALAHERGILIHLDSLGPETADAAMQYVERAAKLSRTVGCTLPSRWRRSLDDAVPLADLGAHVRIVKGQWSDPGGTRLDCRRTYLEIANRLAGRCRSVGIATHDLPLAAKALRILGSRKTRCELEQFFSLPLNGAALAGRHGYPYRLYVAYGRPGIPYNTRFALSRPGMAAWVLADFALHRRKPWMDASEHPQQQDAMVP